MIVGGSGNRPVELEIGVGTKLPLRNDLLQSVQGRLNALQGRTVMPKCGKAGGVSFDRNSKLKATADIGDACQGRELLDSRSRLTFDKTARTLPGVNHPIVTEFRQCIPGPPDATPQTPAHSPIRSVTWYLPASPEK